MDYANPDELWIQGLDSDQGRPSQTAAARRQENSFASKDLFGILVEVCGNMNSYVHLFIVSSIFESNHWKRYCTWPASLEHGGHCDTRGLIGQAHSLNLVGWKVIYSTFDAKGLWFLIIDILSDLPKFGRFRSFKPKLQRLRHPMSLRNLCRVSWFSRRNEMCR